MLIDKLGFLACCAYYLVIYFCLIAVEEATILKVLPVQFRLHGTLREVKVFLVERVEVVQEFLDVKWLGGGECEFASGVKVHK